MADADGARRRLGRVLVTGAAGFLGSRLMERLVQDGEEVVSSDLDQGSALPAGFRACDLTRQHEVDALVDGAGIDTIIHAGAVSGPMVMADRPLDIWRINVTGTAALLEAARRNRVGRFVLCSSIDIYGPDPVGMIDEDTPLAPETVYGASKVAAEAALIGYTREHGLDSLALRFSWIYGPGRRTPTTLERLIRAGLSGDPVTLDESAREPTHYLFIDDAVAGVLAAAKVSSTPARRAYNITAGPGVPLGQVVETLRALLPPLRVTFGGDEPHIPASSSFNLTAAANDLRYQPQVSLPEGLSRYTKAIRNQP